jgi:hypothetical protein
MLARPGVLVALGLALTACVSIPQEVKQTFTPPGPGETSYFERRPDAPRPDGFAAPTPPPPTPPPPPPATTTPTPTPTSTSTTTPTSTPTPAPSVTP